MADTTTDAVLLHPNDNICVAARGITAGDAIAVGDQQLSLQQDIKIGHKIALTSIAEKEPIYKFGQIIGFSNCEISSGDWVHSHNMISGDFALDYAKSEAIPPAPTPITDRTFMGYRRANGKAGTRNYVAVISTVNCSASVAQYVAGNFGPEQLKNYPNIDGVVAFKHDGGCAMAFAGLKHEMLNRVMGGIARHPNIGAYLLIGLGCEQGAMGYLVESQQLVQIGGNGESNGDNGRPTMLSIQDEGGTAKTIEKGIQALAKLLPGANDVKRVPIPASEIILGCECGGSDGNSGITANPALGVASDLLVACGGTSILSETSEIYGAEHLLTRRAVTPEVADKLIERIEWWKWYAGIYGGELNNNPSVGNKEGGLTTIAEKSLGAVAKAGSSALVDVYQYAEPVTAKGLVIMDTPGFDPASVTGKVAGGANVIAFTTGRGSCFGCKPTPSIKIATNTPMYNRLSDDMDINAGEVLSGKTVQQVGEEIFEKILEVASGEQTRSEVHGYGDEEFSPWTVGPVL